MGIHGGRLAWARFVFNDIYPSIQDTLIKLRPPREKFGPIVQPHRSRRTGPCPPHSFANTFSDWRVPSGAPRPWVPRAGPPSGSPLARPREEGRAGLARVGAERAAPHRLRPACAGHLCNTAAGCPRAAGSHRRRSAQRVSCAPSAARGPPLPPRRSPGSSPGHVCAEPNAEYHRIDVANENPAGSPRRLDDSLRFPLGATSRPGPSEGASSTMGVPCTLASSCAMRRMLVAVTRDVRRNIAGLRQTHAPTSHAMARGRECREGMRYRPTSWGTMQRITCVRGAMPWRLSAPQRTPRRTTTASSA